MLRTLSILIFLYLMMFNPLSGQGNKFIVKDKVTGLPVESAHVQFHTLSGKLAGYLITNIDGEAVFTGVTPIIASITAVSYKTVCDTIDTARLTTVLLSPEYYQLDHVVVTGQFRPQPVDKSIYKIKVIDRKQIQLKAANNIGDLLRTDLSFQYRPEGVLGDFIRIRGLSGEYIKILIDGMPITGRIADRIDLGQLNLLNVDHIEIIEGPMSVIYGSNALAGAINIITSDNCPFPKKLKAQLNSYYETVGVYNFDASAFFKSGRSSYSINGARNFHSGWGPIDTSRFKIWKPKLQYLAGGWYQYTKDKLKVTYSTDFLHEELRDLDSLSMAGLYERATDNYHFTRRWNNRFSFYNQLHDNFIINFQAGYSWYSKRIITYNNDLVNLIKTKCGGDTTTFHLVSARGVVSNTPGNNLEYQTGIDYSYEQALGGRIVGTKAISEVAGFLNLIYTPFKIISLQPGLRYIYNSKYNAPLVYAMNVKFIPGNFIIRGSYAKGFKAPSLKQLYLNFHDSNHTIDGNENLLSETADNFSFSANYQYEFSKHLIETEVDFFYNSIENAIQFAENINGAGTGTYFNIENNKFNTKGLETSLSYYFMHRIILKTGYTLTGRSRFDNPEKFEYSGDIASSFSYHSRKYNFDLAAFYKYTDDYLDFTGSFNVDGKINGIRQRYVKPYHTLDITLSKPLFHNKLTVSGGVKNMFDITMVESSGTLNYHGSGDNSTAVGYGRTFFIKLCFQFEKY